MTHQAEASLILIASEGTASIARLLGRLRRQTAAAKLEIVIAAEAPHVIEIGALSEPAFADLRVIEADLGTSARARAQAIFEARAPILILVEDHSFPVTDDWAERILLAHRNEYTGVGPAIHNANPATAISWANLIVEYGPFMNPKGAGETDFLPGHNSSYRRDALIAFGAGLVGMLEAEWVLQTKLRACGHRFWIDPSIAVAHLNYARFWPSFELQLLGGWMFAASRSEAWTVPRRLFYAALFPAIVLLRVHRATGQTLRAPKARANALRSLPMAALLLLASGLGEGIGYAFGDLGRRNALARMEYARWRNLLPNEFGLAR